MTKTSSRGTPQQKPNKKPADSKAASVKPKSPGMTWWGQRWIEALERSSRDVVARLGKGRAYALMVMCMA